MKYRHLVWITIASLLFAVLATTKQASATVTLTTAQLQGTQLRVDGSGAIHNAGIQVDGILMGQSDNQGRFSIRRSGFSSATCIITVFDGTDPVRVTLAGCTPSATPTPLPGPSAPAPLAPANGAQLIEPFGLS